MSQDNAAPLTKADGKMILEIMNQILARLDEHSKRFDTAREETALLIENLRADVLDARKDQVARHEDRLDDHARRIVRLEDKVAV